MVLVKVGVTVAVWVLVGEAAGNVNVAEMVSDKVPVIVSVGVAVPRLLEEDDCHNKAIPKQ